MAVLPAAATARYSRQGKRSSPSHFCYLFFLQCSFGSFIFSNSRFLIFPTKVLLFAGTAVNDFLCKCYAMLGSLSIAKHSLNCHHCQTDTHPGYPLSLPLLLASRQQGNNQGKLKKSSPFFILYFILASLLTTSSSHTSFRCQHGFSFTSQRASSSSWLVSAIGLKTNLIAMIKSSGKSIFGALLLDCYHPDGMQLSVFTKKKGA